MELEEVQQWITPEEYQREYRRLMATGIPDDAPEFQALIERVVERDNHLYERYGKPLMAEHRGKWIAIALDGETILGDSVSEVHWEACERFGSGGFSLRRLAEFPGHEIYF
jgi:hypothetical protein